MATVDNRREEQVKNAKKLLQRHRQRQQASNDSLESNDTLPISLPSPANSPPPLDPIMQGTNQPAATLGFHQHRRSLSKEAPTITPLVIAKAPRASPLPSSALWGSSPQASPIPSSADGPLVSYTHPNMQPSWAPTAHGRGPSHSRRPSSHARRTSRSSISGAGGGGHGHRRSKGSSISIAMKDAPKFQQQLWQARALSQSQSANNLVVAAGPSPAQSPTTWSGFPRGGGGGSSASSGSFSGTVSPNSPGMAPAQPRKPTVSRGDGPNGFVFPRTAPAANSAQQQGPKTFVFPANKPAPSPGGGNGALSGGEQLSTTPRGPPPSHVRTQSRHRRLSSVSNRRESLSLMGGLGAASQASDASDVGEADASDTDGEGGYASASARKGALRALEGRLRERSMAIDLEEASECGSRTGSPRLTPKCLAPLSPVGNVGGGSSPPSPMNLTPNGSDREAAGAGIFGTPGRVRNGSWGSGSGLGLGGGMGMGMGMGMSGPPGIVGATGASALGMVMEEEEEEEEEDLTAPTPEETPASSRRSSRAGSPTGRRRSSTATKAAPRLERTSTLESVRTTSTSSAHVSELSSSRTDSISSDIISNKRGLKSLTLSMGTNRSSGSTEAASPKTPQEQRRRSSLIYGTPSPALPSRSNSTSMTASDSGFGSAGSRRGSMIDSPTLNGGGTFPPRQRVSSLTKRSSISYKKDESSSAAGPQTPMSAFGSGSFSFPQTPTAYVPQTPTTFNGGLFGGLEMEGEESGAEGGDGDSKAIAQLKAQVEQLRGELVDRTKEVAVIKQESTRLLREAKVRYVDLEREAAEDRDLHKARTDELEGQLKRARQSLEADAASRLSEMESLRRELESVRDTCEDAVAERDMLREDVVGWRQRTNDLERNLIAEKVRVEEERRENTVARDTIRKLGDRLTAMGTSAAESASQAKVIAEMKGQVFQLASELEKERQTHVETRKELEAARAREDATDIFAPSEGRTVRDESSTDASEDDKAPKRHQPGVNSDGSVLSNGSFGPSFSGTDSRRHSTQAFGESDTSYYTQSSDEETAMSKFSTPASGSLSSIASFGSGSFKMGEYVSTPSIVLGGLQTLAEEDEDEEEEEQFVEQEDHFFAPPFSATITGEDGVSTELPPIPEASPVIPPPSAPADQTHARRDSFIKNWAFPKGPVLARSSLDSQERHSFFGLDKHSPLPPLPLPDSALNLPAFLMGSLDIDEPEPPAVQEIVIPSHIRRPSSPRPSPISPCHPKRPSLAISTPPIARSAHQHASLASLSGVMVQSPVTTSGASTPVSESSMLKRLSLQSLTSLFGSFGASSLMSPTAAQIAVTASKLCSTDREDEGGLRSPSDETTRPLLIRPSAKKQSSLNPKRDSRRFVTAEQQPRPVASPLSVLDFSRVCGSCDSELIIV